MESKCEEVEFSVRGVKTKLFGFVIMALGVLDCLLNLRGGIPAYEKFLVLILVGACVYAIGAVRGGQQVSVRRDVQGGNSGVHQEK